MALRRCVARAFCLLLGVVAGGAPLHAFAGGISIDKVGGIEVVATLGVDSVGVFRGLKSRRLNPSVYAIMEISRGAAYSGAYAAPVGFESETVPLVYAYAGYAPSALGFDFDMGLGYYAFPGSGRFEIDVDSDGVTDHSGKKELFEPYAGVSKTLKFAELEFVAFYTPSNFGRTGEAWYYAGDATVPVSHGFAFVAHCGASEYANDVFNDDYSDYFVGVEKTLWGFDLALKYSNAADLAGGAEEAVVFSISRDFTLASDEHRRERRYRKIRNDFVIDKTRLRGVR